MRFQSLVPLFNFRSRSFACMTCISFFLPLPDTIISIEGSEDYTLWNIERAEWNQDQDPVCILILDI